MDWVTRTTLKTLAIVLIPLLVLILISSHGRCDPAGYENQPFFKWYGSVHMPDNPLASCCGAGDAFKMLEYHASDRPGYSFEGWTQPKVKPEGYTVSSLYVYIPNEKVNWDDTNPVGVGIVWLGGGGVIETGSWDPMVLCFVPGSGS